MADASAGAAPRKKGLIARMMVPLAMLLVGLGAGAAGAFYAPAIMPVAGPKVPEPTPLPIEYLEIDSSFTANLKDSGRFVQLRIAVSTHGGKTVLEQVERHRLAIIAATLSVLANSSEAELASTGGRDRLAADMRRAINDVLQRKSGVAGIDDVFLTSFVLQ